MNELFSGNSEMARRVREFDWSKSALGPVDGWSTSLVSTLSLCLSARFPMAIYWGSEGFLFYNDAWRPILGDKHPWALGRPAQEVWPEIWDLIAPLFESVLISGEATWRGDALLPMRRFGYTEECYFDYTFNPIQGENGKVEGILNVVQETTFRVLTERRTRLLRELASACASAKSDSDACDMAISALSTDPADIPFAIFYLIETDRFHAYPCKATGLPDGSPALVDRISLAEDSGDNSWPLAMAERSGNSIVVDDLGGRFGELSVGLWPEPTSQALVLPIKPVGHDAVSAILVTGVNPRHGLDDDYRSFFESVAANIATAMTNARAYEEERNRLDALAQIDRTKTAFFSNVSHEFRTPLTLILGPAEELLSGALGDTTELQRAHLATLRHNAVRLQKLVNTMLDFARVEAGRIEATYEPVDLAVLTRDVASTFCSAVYRAGLLFVVNCASIDDPIYVDRDMWEKIVLNLLSNALKFTFKGSIELSLQSNGDSVAFAVRDTGVGIPEEELPLLFDRFHRVQGAQSRTQEGSGIGLALVQELVKLHGGSVKVDSVVGSGTTFTVSIPKGSAHLPKERIGAPQTMFSTALGAAPFVEEALRWLPDNYPGGDASMSISAASFTGTLPAIAAGSERILIADDNSEMRDYLKRLLETRWQVTAVPDGVKALESARAQPPDLVLSDVMMPALNGFDLLRELRADERLKTIPVIMLSARAGEEASVEGMEAGADDYLVKPFSARELLARVDAHLKLHGVRREAERSLRASEERYRRLVGLLPAALYTCESPSGMITFYNDHAAELWGRAPRIGDTDECFCGSFKLWWPDGKFLPHNQAPMALALREGREFRNQEVVIERPDGTRITVLVNIDPVRDESGRLVGAINVFQDMTALKQAENERAVERNRADAMLRESEERFRKMADSSPIMIWMTDAAGRTSFLNRTYLEYFDIPAEQAAEFDWSAAIHPEDREAYVASFKAALEKSGNFHQRVRLQRADGQWRWFESRGNPILDAMGKMIGYIGSSPDITDIYESQQALKELDQRKDAFLANMSHEIRSPLTGIMGYADILLGKATDAEDIEYLKTIKESGEYLIEIVNDILDISKIEAGKLVLNIETVSIHSVLAEVQGLMDVRARQKHLPLEERHEGALPESVQTDRTRLRQILINLVSNAIKFTERGRVEIVARFISGDNLLQIEVIDTGTGISKEHQQVLFQPFTQADSTRTRKYGGTGLGLSITRRLVEILGGGISFESRLNRGSTFRVTIPARTARSAKAPGSKARSRTGFDSTLLRDRRMLVVDDREEICRLVSKFVTDAGGRADAVEDGEAAIEMIEANAATDPFNGMVLDIHMPIMDGYDVARTLRAKGFQIPIIALTASAMVGDREKCLEAGCNEYLTKPIDRIKLVQILARLTQKTTPVVKGNGNRLKILLVDDSHATCKLLTRILEKHGHEIHSAYDGESAISLARDISPDVIFLDIRLPDMNGYELMQRLKEQNGTHQPRFVGLSGDRAADVPGAIEFDHFLEKPLDRALLDTILESL